MISSYDTFDINTFAKHTAILGSTGSGKTGLLLGLCEYLIDNGVYVILVDVKGDLANIATSESIQNCRLLTPSGSVDTANCSILDSSHDSSLAVDQLVALTNTKLNNKEMSFLYAASEELFKFSIQGLLEEVMSPSFDTVGLLPTEDVLSYRERATLANKINSIASDKRVLNLIDGPQLDFYNLLSDEGSCIVYSVASMSEDEQKVAIAGLTSSLKRHVWANPSPELNIVLVIDECVGIIPTAPKTSPAKETIMSIAKQGRAFGLGLILATQNPVDIDYKVLSNCNTWFVGKLSTQRDIDKASLGLGGASYKKELASLEHRQFLFKSEGMSGLLSTPEVSCEMTGPVLDLEDLDFYACPRVEEKAKSSPAKEILRVEEEEEVVPIKETKWWRRAIGYLWSLEMDLEDVTFR